MLAGDSKKEEKREKEVEPYCERTGCLYNVQLQQKNFLLDVLLNLFLCFPHLQTFVFTIRELFKSSLTIRMLKQIVVYVECLFFVLFLFSIYSVNQSSSQFYLWRILLTDTGVLLVESLLYNSHDTWFVYQILHSKSSTPVWRVAGKLGHPSLFRVSATSFHFGLLILDKGSA